MHKCFTVFVSYTGDFLSSTGRHETGYNLIRSNSNSSHEISVVWNGTSFTANGTLQDASYIGYQNTGNRVVKISGTLSNDGKTLLSFSVDVTANYLSPSDNSTMAESLKLAGNNIPLESFVQRPLYSYNAATYKFCGSNLKTLMTLISINVTAKDKDGKIYGQYIYSSTVWDSVMTPCIEITFGDDWNRV